VTLESSTVTGNVLTSPYYVPHGGGVGIFPSDSPGGTLTLQRSIISGNGNASAVGREIYVKADTVVHANDFNVFGRSGDAGVAGFTPGSTDIVPNQPIGGILLPLTDNGGDFDTRTHALAIGSPALDASPHDATCPATDQRGNPRPRGSACDIGSFEGSAVMCNGRATTMVGTINDDKLTGTPGPDLISGLTGDDDISGRNGDDIVCGGAGSDVMYGGPGSDLLFGGPGNDRLLGQGGGDTLNGGVDADVCDGGRDSGAVDTATACENVSSVP
jgi:Ca2+-binding RTX toxin-like protein